MAEEGWEVDEASAARLSVKTMQVSGAKLHCELHCAHGSYAFKHRGFTGPDHAALVAAGIANPVGASFLKIRTESHSASSAGDMPFGRVPVAEHEVGAQPIWCTNASGT
eukprot:1799344-Amphidinium_carterae.3